MAARRPVYDVYPPRIESIDSLNLALAELCRIDCFEKRMSARIDEAAARIREEGADSMTVAVGDEEELPLAKWRGQLEAAIEKYAVKHRDELLEEGKKSREFNHATLGWRKQKPSLKPIGDFTTVGNPKHLDMIVAVLRTALAACSDLVGAIAARFIDVKVSYRKMELLKAVKDKDLTAAELRKAGFELDDEGESFFIETKGDEVTAGSHSESGR